MIAVLAVLAALAVFLAAATSPLWIPQLGVRLERLLTRQPHHPAGCQCPEHQAWRELRRHGRRETTR